MIFGLNRLVKVVMIPLSLRTSLPTTTTTTNTPNTILMMNNFDSDSIDTSNSNNNNNNNNNNIIPMTQRTKRGAFIVFEGLDRCGKTTQSTKLVSTLERKLQLQQQASVEQSEQEQTSVVTTKLMRFPDRTTATGHIINTYLQQKPNTSDKDNNNNNKDVVLFNDDDHAIHLLFSANRWESASTITNTLHNGTTIICDRYAHSGVAFSSAKVKSTTDTDTDFVKQNDKENDNEQSNNDENTDVKISDDNKSVTTTEQIEKYDISNTNTNTNTNTNIDYIPLLDFNWCINSDRGLPAPDCIIYLDILPNVTNQRGGYGIERYEQYDLQQRVRTQFFKLQQMDSTCSKSTSTSNTTPKWYIIDATKSIDDIAKEVEQIALQSIEQVQYTSIGKLWEIE